MSSNNSSFAARQRTQLGRSSVAAQDQVAGIRGASRQLALDLAEIPGFNKCAQLRGSCNSDECVQAQQEAPQLTHDCSAQVHQPWSQVQGRIDYVGVAVRKCQEKVALALPAADVMGAHVRSSLKRNMLHTEEDAAEGLYTIERAEERMRRNRER